MSLTDLSQFQSDPLAAGALSQIAAGKWRRARDTAKELFKKDRAKYAPLLIAANAGLAGEMLDRGLTEDAATVIAYLKTIAPPAVVEDLEGRIRKRQSAAVLAKGTPAEVLSTAWEIVSRAPAGPPSADLLNAADHLAVSPLLPPGTDFPETRAEWAAVRAAVDATARGAWEEARTALRGVSARSVFGSWRLFLRGVRCVHTGEPEAARQCFTALPPGTATARAAWAYRQVCGLPAGPDRPPAAVRITFPAALCGASVKAAAAIAEAEALWRKHDIPGAFTTLIPGFGRAEFPTDSPGLPGVLTALLLGNRFRNSTLPAADFDHFAEWMDRRVKKRGAVPPMEEKLIRLQLLRLEGHVMEGDEVTEHAERIIELDTKLRGPDPLRAAAVWELAAELLKDTGGEELSPFAADRPPHARTAALRHCAELDPDHAPRVLALAENLKFRQREEERAALLADAVRRFPDHPGILAAAGDAALGAGNPEAPALLRKAVRMDPGNLPVAAALFILVQDMADRADGFDAALWDELESLARATPAVPPDSPETLGLERQRWFVKLRRALADPHSPPAGQPASAADAALRLAPSVFTGNLALSILTGTPPEEKTGVLATSPDAPAAAVTWRDIYWAVHLMQWRLREKNDHPWRESMEAFLTDAARELLTRRALSSPEGSQGVLAFARTVSAILEIRDDRPTDALPLRFIPAVAKAVADPVVRAAGYRGQLASILLPVSCRDYTLPCSCRELGLVESAAKAAGDPGSAALAARLITRCGDLPPPPWTRLRPLKKPKPAAKKTTASKKKAPAAFPAADKAAAAAAPPDSSPKAATAKVPAKKAAAAKKTAAAKKKAAPKKKPAKRTWRLDPALQQEFAKIMTQFLNQPDLFD
ncbi:MAG: hypothetical protein V4726_24505 [Verrucomicrobiota bacterium]